MAAFSLRKYGILIFPLGSFGLGVWQVQRLDWKKKLIADIDKRLISDPIELTSIDSFDDMSSLEYTRVKVKGKFDHNPNNHLILKPVSLVSNKESINRGYHPDIANIGVNVITRFIVDDTNLTIIVNRGWCSLRGNNNLADNINKGLGEKGKSIEITGILRATDDRGRFGKNNQIGSREWVSRDVDRMAKTLNTAPIFIDADENLAIGEGPIGGQTRLSVRNMHFSYIVTWFSLAAITAAMSWSKIRKIKAIKR